MDRKTLEQKLWSYKSDQVRAEYLQRYIPLMEKRLSLLKEEALQNIGKAPALDAVRASAGPGDPTALMAARAAEDALTVEMRDCRDRLCRLRQESASLEAHNELMDCLLSTLTEESRWLVTCRYIDHTSWPVLAARYKERYGIDYSQLTLRRRCTQALYALCGTCEKAG